MEERNIFKMIFDGTSISEKNIQIVIKTFSAYLDKYEENYCYNYKYLPSHLDEFCKANKLLPKFQDKCQELIDTLTKEIHFKNLISQIIASNQIIELKLSFNKSIQYDFTKEKILGIKEKSHLGVPEKNSWVNKDNISIDLRLDFIYRDFHFIKNVYGITKDNILEIYNDFMNNSYKVIVENYLRKELIELVNFMCKYVLTDYQILVSDCFIFYPLKYNNVDKLYENGVIQFKEGEKDIIKIYFNKFAETISLKKDLIEIIETINKFFENSKGDSDDKK